MVGPVKAIKPDDQPSPNLNCIGGVEEALPRVHTRGKPVAIMEAVARLLGRANTLRVSSTMLEVTSDFRGVRPISTAPMTNTNILEQAVALRA